MFLHTSLFHDEYLITYHNYNLILPPGAVTCYFHSFLLLSCKGHPLILSSECGCLGSSFRIYIPERQGLRHGKKPLCDG